MRKLIIAAAMLTSACATQYGEIGLTGGVHATRVQDDTIMIEARGNGYTGLATIAQFVLRKAAEETLKDGYDLFWVINTQDDSRAGSITLPGSANSSTTLQGHALQTTTVYSPPETIGFVKPGAVVTVKMMKGQLPANPQHGLYDAHAIVAYMTPPPKAK